MWQKTIHIRSALVNHAYDAQLAKNKICIQTLKYTKVTLHTCRLAIDQKTETNSHL